MPVDVNTELKIAVEYNGDGTELFVGDATPGTLQNASGWRIKKLSYNNDQQLIKLEWADGKAEFNKVWDDRGSFTYAS